MCETLWYGAFIYDNTNSGFTMSFDVGQPNPNDAIHTEVVAPDPCPGHNVTEAGQDAACPAVRPYAA